MRVAGADIVEGPSSGGEAAHGVGVAARGEGGQGWGGCGGEEDAGGKEGEAGVVERGAVDAWFGEGEMQMAIPWGERGP